MSLLKLIKKTGSSLLPLLFMLSLNKPVVAQENASIPIADQNPVDDSVYMSVQHMPEPTFDMERYLHKNIKYPESARKAKITGRFLARFTVGKDGKIRDLEVIKPLCPDCAEEALRVINAMPPWKPGIHFGKPVNVTYVLPITFERWGSPLR
jgi:TonB family protein